MGIYIKLLIQPFISLFSLVALFFGRKSRKIDLDDDSAYNYYRVYYYTIRNRTIKEQEEFAKYGKNYLQGVWGMVKYPHNSPAVKQTEKEVLYASLGEVRNRDLHLDSGPFELAANGILGNDFALFDPVPKKPAEIMNFRENFHMNSSKALAFTAMISVLKRSGDLWAKDTLYPQCWKCYKVFLLMPDFRQVEDVLVAYHILSRYTESSLLKKWIKMVVILLGLVYSHKMNDFSKFIIKETVYGN